MSTPVYGQPFPFPYPAPPLDPLDPPVQAGGTNPAAVTTTIDLTYHGGLIARYRTDPGLEDIRTVTFRPALKLRLLPGDYRAGVPGSVQFKIGSRAYVDRGGLLYYGISPSTGEGTLGGSYDYASNVATVTDYPGGQQTLTVESLAVVIPDVGVNEVVFRVPTAPLRPTGFQVRAIAVDDGTQLVGSGQPDGSVAGTDIDGTVNYQTGVVICRFGSEIGGVWTPRAVWPTTIFYNAVTYSFVPLDAALIGLDPTRLPIDGRVPVYRAGDIVFISRGYIHSETELTPGETITLPKQRLDKAYIAGVLTATGKETELYATEYAVDLEAGTVTVDADANLAGFEGPWKVYYRQAERALVLETRVDGTLKLAGGVGRDYDTDTLVSSCMMVGTLQGRVSKIYSQKVWTSVWSSVLIGDPAIAQYNDNGFPVVVTNVTARKGRYVLVWKTNTDVDIIEENAGYLALNITILSDVVIPDPVTGDPVMTLSAGGFGGGWIPGNALRIDLEGAGAPVWALRCVRPGQPTADFDSVTLELMGDVEP